MYNEHVVPSIVTPSTRNPKSSFTSRLRLNKGPANQHQQYEPQSQIQHNQQLNQQAQHARQSIPIHQQRYLTSCKILPYGPIASTLSSSRRQNNNAGPSQHPSQYPISAIQALEEVELTLAPLTAQVRVQSSRPSSSLKEAALPHSYNSTSTPTSSVRLSSSEAYPSLSPPLQLSNKYTISTFENSETPCSESSSEFSISAAFPGEEEGMAISVRQALGGKGGNAAIKRSPEHVSDNRLLSSSRCSDFSVSIVPQPCEPLVKSRKGRSMKIRGNYDNEDYQGTQKNMVFKKRSKYTVESMLKAAQAEEIGFYSSSSTTSTCEEEVPPRPRIRTITLASHTTTQKSPPPPLLTRKSRAMIPPSPMTPKQIQRPTRNSKTSSTPPHHDTSTSTLMTGNNATLGVTRPPRPTRRCPSPFANAESHTPTGAYKIEACQDDDTPIFDFVDGIRWEMLNKIELAKGIGSLPKQDLRQGRPEDEKQISIEQWRSKAGPTISSAITGSEGGQVDEGEDEPWDETIRESQHQISSCNPATAPSSAPLSTMNSNLSLATAQSFQSISSMGNSTFTALADLPKSPSDQNSKLLSTQPDTVTLVPFIHSQWASKWNAKSGEAVSHLPGTFPGFPSSQSLVFQQCKRPSTPAKVIESILPDASTCIYKSPGCTIFSDPSSGAFESADEGPSSGFSPQPKSTRPSPRVRLSRQYNAERRASRLFGMSEKTVGKSEGKAKEGESHGQSGFDLTAAQLMALSEEAESGLLDPVELRILHDNLVTPDEDSCKEREFNVGNFPTPELWRQSLTSKEEEFLKTPFSSSCEGYGEKKGSGINCIIESGGEFLFESGIDGAAGLELSDGVPRMQSRIESNFSQPHRPLARRRSKRVSVVPRLGDDGISKQVKATFTKLSSIPIQLVDAPVQISWKSSLSGQEYEEFASTFGSSEMHRQEVIEELILTEWNFVASINSILRVFSMPLRNSDLTFMMDVPLEVARLFNWLDDILAYHIKLLKSLDKVKTRHPSALIVSVAGAIFKHIEGLSIHQSYLVNFKRVTKLIEDVRRSDNKGDLANFDHLIESQCRLPECRGMGLSSFLLKPVQRLMKYPLFFKVSVSSQC